MEFKLNQANMRVASNFRLKIESRQIDTVSEKFTKQN